MNKREHKLKIAISGTSCCGKTTIVNALKDKYESKDHIVIVDEVARQYFLDNPMPEVERFTPTTQKRILHKIIDTERQAANSSASLIICDNSIIAAAAFTSVLNGQAVALEMLNNNSEWIETYSFMYVLDPKDVIFQNDDVRKEGLAFRNEVHQQFLLLLDRFNVDYKIIGGTVNERLNTINEELEKYY